MSYWLLVIGHQLLVCGFVLVLNAIDLVAWTLVFLQLKDLRITSIRRVRTAHLTSIISHHSSLINHQSLVIGLVLIINDLQ